MIVFFSDANNINNFPNSTDYDININIRDACIGLGILCILKLLFLFGPYYDVHSYIKNKTNIKLSVIKYK